MSAHRFRFLACLTSLALACCAALFAAMPAASADVSPSETLQLAYADAIDATVLELSYLQLSGAFGDHVPGDLVELPARIGLANASASDVADGFSLVNAHDGPAALLELQQLNQPLTIPIRAVLSSEPTISPTGVPWAPYVRAYHDLVAGRLGVVGESISPEADTLGLLALFNEIPSASEVQVIDRGHPPEVLVQGNGDPTTAGPRVAPVRSPATPNVSADIVPLDPVEILIAAAVAVIVLGLITLLVTSKQRHQVSQQEAGHSSNRAFIDATRIIHAAETVEQLCVVAAASARLLTNADSVAITIDGYEAADGPAFDTSTDLVFRANREACLVSNGVVHAIPVTDADDEIVGLLVMKGGQVSKLEAFEPLVEDGYASVVAKEQTAALVFVDGLTGIANRRRFDTDLDVLVDRAIETHTPVAVAMFDVDHFKTFNDSNGHQAGDIVLRAVAEVIAKNLRATDVVYRYGGEEFVALLPGATIEDAYDVVERIRLAVERAAFDGESSQPGGTVTLSVGVAAAPTGDGSMLVRAADMALYQAKTTGRNRVVAETHLG